MSGRLQISTAVAIIHRRPGFAAWAVRAPDRTPKHVRIAVDVGESHREAILDAALLEREGIERENRLVRCGSLRFRRAKKET